MIEPSDAYYSVGGGAIALAAQMLWQKFVSTEGKASDQLVQQLADETRSLRERMTTLETGLDEERRMRRLAENKVHALQLDNVVLRAELRRHGIEVPAPLGVPADPEIAKAGMA